MANDAPGSYSGKILRVNLTNQTIVEETLSERFLRMYLGGAGLVAYFLWQELPQGTDPLSPDNKLIFSLGPVTGISLPGSGRHCVGAKSPLTNGIAKSEAGGFWGAKLKHAGYDAIIVEGKAEAPAYLWIHDGEANIRVATNLWGKNTKETQQAIMDELCDSRISVAAIGPGGENLVRYACIINDLHYAAGRGGLGAVMGSKNLKAVAVKGHNAPYIENRKRIGELRQWVWSTMHQFTFLSSIHDFGTGAAMAGYEAIGNLPIRNFRQGSFPSVGKITAQTLRNTIGIGMEGCFACPVRCKKVVKVEEPYPVDPAYGGPEYETLAGLGSNCGIDSLEAIAKGNELCNAYSLDTISVAGVIAFAMECFENGILTTKDTDGLELRFGNEDAMLNMIDLIARRRGIGDLLAEGTRRAAQKIGHGASELAIQVKGLELPMHEPRLQPGLGLGYMVNPHGGDHVSNLLDTLYTTEEQIKGLRPLGIIEPLNRDLIDPRKVALFRLVQLQRIVSDTLVMCRFLPYTSEQVADVVAAITGWNTGVIEQLRVAERILTLCRLFNLREGLTASDDVLPVRFFQPKTNGSLASKPLDAAKLEKAKSFYYTLMGWGACTGIPMPEKVMELGLGT